tara:strand:- start:216 stop:1199 length:984 start_codon:yes stop_codon:yes gene_type:complete
MSKSNDSNLSEMRVGDLLMTEHSLGIIEVTPRQAGENSTAYVYSCGIHGNETAPIEIVNDMLADIESGVLKIKNPLLIIFGNIQAMREGKRFIENNLNRMFSREHKKYDIEDDEPKRAKEIEESISVFFNKYKNLNKVHYDLHTAIRPSKYPKFAVYPSLKEGRCYSKNQLKLLSTMGLGAVLLMHKFSPTLSYYSSTTHGAEAFTLELGKVEKFGDNIRPNFKDTEEVLRSLVSGEKFETSNKYPKLCQVKKELIRHEQEYDFKISDDTANFTEFKKGTVLASDSVETYKVEEDGEMIAFPNGNVKVKQRSGLIMRVVSPSDIQIV